MNYEVYGKVRLIPDGKFVRSTESIYRVIHVEEKFGLDVLSIATEK